MENIILGFSQVFQPVNLLVLAGGVIVGLIVGALPGLNDSITMAILIPVTFGMSPQIAMCLLTGVYVSACYGGSLPAILLNIPGTASSVCTTLDGYAMTKQGRAGEALGISTTSSLFGGLMSSLILMFLAPFLAEQALRFGPPEYCTLALLGMSTIVGLANKGEYLKSIISMLLGLMVACVGISPQVGYTRFWFGSAYLLEGVPFIPLMIGLFGVCSLFELAENLVKTDSAMKEKISAKIGRILPSKEMCKRLLPTWLVSGAIGNVIGILPGAGMVMAVYTAYAQAARSHKDLKFGTGVPEGVAAPETANNAVVASSMVPLLSLGIPGAPAAALFIGALMIQGLRPGPSLFSDYPEVAYLIIVAFFVANCIMFPFGVMMCKFLSKTILQIPRDILAGAIALLCVTGAFAVSNNMFNVKVLLIFGVIGYVFKKLGISHSPFILAVILGPTIEMNYLQSMVLSDGSWMIFLTRPISLALFVASLLFVGMPVIKKGIARVKKSQ